MKTLINHNNSNDTMSYINRGVNLTSQEDQNNYNEIQ